MKRAVPILVILLSLCAVGLYYFNQYWIHRYDALIARQAAIYRLDPDLVWSVIYEETYFRPWMVGGDGEIGLMQVTPTVGREWAAETGMRDLERQMGRDPQNALRDPERNIQIGCWYLEKLFQEYRDVPGAEARMIAGYNAGPSRAADWNRVDGSSSSSGGSNSRPLTADQFIARIDIPSTRAYVTSILERYRKLKQSKGQQQQPAGR
ncbi:MAG TPA: transglycosylase SLT domain-containing protein [Pyrinomonadaceae bacterium]|jgi:soluble lytic murein transglycosylase|nr:transglycosylase SLT domain-containing protein [Pyrinomonadaceae bacterium]